MDSIDNLNEIEGVVEHPSQKMIFFQGPKAYDNAIKFMDFVKPQAFTLESGRSGVNGEHFAVRVVYTGQKS